jgi:hypothetical protein
MKKVYFVSTSLVYQQEAKFSGLAPLKTPTQLAKYEDGNKHWEDMLSEGTDSFLDVIFGP